jgi:6-phosphogluconolactonase
VSTTFVYVGNAENNDIHVLELAQQTGELTLVDKVAVPGVTRSGGSIPLAVSPDKRFLYAAIRGEPLVAAGFAIDPASGKLEHVANGPLVDSMAYIVTDRSGRFLLGASYSGHKITVNSIGMPGIVEAAQQVLATEPNAHCIAPDADNRYVLSTSLGADLVYQWRFDAATGTLSPNAPAAVRVKDKAGPRHLVFHPDGTFVYLLNELDASIYAFAYDRASGRLSELQTVTAWPPGFDGKPWAADIHVTPDGRFLYASERRSSTLSGFKIDVGTGTLSPLESVPTEKQPRSFAIDPAGRYLLAAGEASNRMTSYAIDAATGKLTRLKQYPMGTKPNWVEIVALP